MLLPMGDTNFTVRKLVPATAPLGEVDLTELNVSKVGDPSVYDTVSLYTDTIHPGNVEKQLYLHGDSERTLNTTQPTVSSSETRIAANSLDSWAQQPPFASEFVLSGDAVITLYLRDDFGASHDVVVTLLYTDGSSSTVIGYASASLDLSTSLTPYTFTIHLTSETRVPRGSYLILRVENQAPSPMYVGHDSSHPSEVEVSTYTYVDVEDVSTDGRDYSPGDTVTVTANVTDPIGAYDISQVRIDVYRPDDTLYLSDTMTLSQEDPGSPPLWRIYTYSFSLSDYGAYTVEITAVETNGVENSKNITVYVSWPIVGRVYEDFSPLGSLDSSDVGLPNVRVFLYNDTNSNGVLDPADGMIDLDVTDGSGRYTLHSIVGGRVFVAVDSRTLISSRGLNPGHSWDEVWAEQTFQREWDGSSWTLVPKFGGRDPEVGDTEGGVREHYVPVEHSNYNGESVDFGFSYEVVVNTLDRESAPTRPVGEVFRVPGVGDSWRIVFTHNYYESPVVVCTYNLPSSSDNEAVVRLKDVGHHSFKVRIQSPGGKPVTPSDVYCLVMEEGAWELDDGRKVEAHRVVSHGTNAERNWGSSLMEHPAYSWTYSQPVILGQVMSFNDSRWSVFWDSNGSRRYPPDPSNLYVGKHVGGDTVQYRNDEILGYVVIEAGNGTTGGLRYSAQMGPATIKGVGNNPPYSYSLDSSYSVGVATQSGMRGGDGGWAVLYGPDPIGTSINLAIDEDTITNSRVHKGERVSYWVFSDGGLIFAKVSGSRYAQGSLRQFLVNANALKGFQRSYFVMMVDPNAGYADAWRVEVNHTLGGLPALNDSAGVWLNGTVYYEDMTVRDSNPGTAGSTGAVGTGTDGVPGTGDECVLQGVSKPELEVYGGGLDDEGLVIEANNTWVSGLSVFGFGVSFPSGGILVNGSSAVLRNVSLFDLMVGPTSSGDDPSSHGLSRNGIRGIWILSGGDLEFTVNETLTAFNGYTGIHVVGGPVRGLMERVESFSNGLAEGVEDGISVEVGSGGVTLNCSYLHDNAAYGFDSWSGIGENVLDEINVTGNGVTASQGEDGGVRIFGNGTVLNRSVIYGNAGPGVVVANWSDGGAISVNNSILVNSIFSNGEVGVDLDATHLGTNPVGDNVTINDGQLVANLPNEGIDYPVIVDFSYDPGSETLVVSGYINREDAHSGSPDFAGADVLIFLVNNTNGGDDLVGNNYSGDTELTQHYGEGWIYLGRLVADSNGEFSGTLDLSSLPSWARPDTGSALTAMAHKDGVGSSEFGPAFKRKPISVSVRKDLEPSGSDCGVSVTLTARNLNPWGTITRIYDTIPAGMVMSSPSVAPDGSSGNVYWWTVTLAPDGSPGSERQITYTLAASSCGSSDYSLSDALLVGVDPPPPPHELRLDVREYLNVRFRPDGTYTVLDHWGFLTLSNPTSDPAEDVRIYPGVPGYVFYPDYPVPSATPASLPLRVEELTPGSHVRWRFTAPLDIRPPVAVREYLAPERVDCGRADRVTLRIRVSALEDAGDVVLRKPLWWADRVVGVAVSTGSVSLSGGDLVWSLGPMGAGDAAELSLTAEVRLPHGIQLPDAEVSFNRSSPPLLRGMRVGYTGSASLAVEKEELPDSYRVRAIFSNLAGNLSYDLTSICVYDGQPGSGRLVFCEEPNATVGAGETWSSTVHEDVPPSKPPAYHAVANFTGIVTSSGSYSSLRKVRDGYVPYAILEEPALGCTSPGGGAETVTESPSGTVTRTLAPPTRVGGRMPTETRPRGGGGRKNRTVSINVSGGAGPNITMEKSCSPSEVEVGDLLVCRIVVTNEGNLSARELRLVDRLPHQLVLAKSGRRMVLWTIEELKPGDRRVYKVILQAVEPGLAVNTVELDGRTASAAVRVRKAVKPVLRKYGFYMGEGTVRYLITVEAGHQVRLTDVLPDDVEVRNVEAFGSPVDWAVRGNMLDLTVRGNGSARIYVDVYYFDWMTGGKMKNRVYIPGGPEARVYVRITGLGSRAYYGALLVPPGIILLVLIFLRRRKGILLDYWSMREILGSGVLPSNGMAITEAAYRRLMESPVMSSLLEELISTGRLGIVRIDEEAAVRALLLARKHGLDLREAADLVVLNPGVGR